MISPEILRRYQLFAGLPLEVLKEIAQFSRELTLEADTYLFQEGDSAEELYLIISGGIDLQLVMPDNGSQNIEVEMIVPGELVGTIFLDEIGDISPAVQTRLLRVLEDKTYEPLGSIHPSRTNARVVVSSHRNLDQLVGEKKFREDLYFRINVMKLSLPPLTERKEDIPLLVNHFIKRFNHEKGLKIMGLTHEAMAALMLYNWPGNIRELENAIEHAFVLCKKKMIDLQLLPEKILSEINVTFTGPLTTLKEIEKNAILQALYRNEWKQSVTAKELGINKNTLRRKMLRYGIEKRQRR